MSEYIAAVSKVTGINPVNFMHAFQIVERMNNRDHYSNYKYNSQRGQYLKAKQIMNLYITGIKIYKSRMI